MFRGTQNWQFAEIFETKSVKLTFVIRSGRPQRFQTRKASLRGGGVGGGGGFHGVGLKLVQI